MGYIQETLKRQLKSRTTLLKQIKNIYYKLPNFYKKKVIGKNNRIVIKGKLLNCRIDIIGDNNTVQISSNTKLSNALIFIRGNNHQLLIGNHCKMKGGELWLQDEGAKIEIGDYTTIVKAHLAATEPRKEIIIGKDCMFAGGIEVRTGDSHSIIDLATNKRINYAKNVRIGNHVWVGANVTILKGAEIHDNAIIGTAAIVTGVVPSNSIVAGTPAKVIRENVTWVREKIY